MNAIQLSSPDNWVMMKEQANMLLKTGFLPGSIRTPEHAIAIMMLGQELGIGAWAALTSINVIQNKPTVSPQLMLALINRSGQLEDLVIEATETGCTVTMKRKGRTPHTETFDRDDANALGLLSKDNYKKQATTMYKWRAIAACARIVFPDVITGLYTPDEMGADTVTDDAGNMTVIEVKAEPAAQPQLVERVDTTSGEITPPAPVNEKAKVDLIVTTNSQGENPLESYGTEGESRIERASDSDAAFDDVALATRNTDQPLALVDHPKNTRTWDIGKVANYVKFKAKHIDVEKEGEAGAEKHFVNLITRLESSIQITDTSSTDEVIKAVDAHYAAKTESQTKKRKLA